MTNRNEKPSPHESSTDTIIEALQIVANLVDRYDDTGMEAQAIREAAARLDKLECELEQLRDANIFKYEHVAWIHDIQHIDGEKDNALSFSETEFPFSDVTGYMSIACAPLYKLRLNN